MTFKKLLLCSSVSALLTISSVAGAVERPYQEHLSVEDLQNVDRDSLNTEKYAKFSDGGSPFDTDHRLAAVREAAMVVGAQHGYISRMNSWKKMLKNIEPKLDALFDFALLMRLVNSNQNGRYLIPPILNKTEDVIRLSEDGRSLKRTNSILSIVRPERLTLAPLNWRSYLIYDEPIEASLPPADLFPDPEKPEEREVWNKAVAEGWVQGAKHAEREMGYRFRRMGEDYTGMAIYAQNTTTGKLTETVVSYSKEDVVGGGNELREGEEIYRIAVPAQFVANPENWKPLVLSARDSLIFPIEDGSSVDPLER